MVLTETAYWVAFNRISTIGRARYERLERAFGSLAAAWEASSGELRAAGLDERSVTAVEAQRPRISPEAELAALQRLGVEALTWHDDRYPRLLKESFDRPPVVYIRGSLLPEDDLALAVVGTRRMSRYGQQVTEQLVPELVGAGITIISGLARGVDATAHAAAVRAGGRTLAVMANGVDIVYPAAHERLARQIVEHGALVSELPLGTRPIKDAFPRRNRIIAGLSLGVVITEAPERSGALLTGKLAADDNRDVFAVPGSIYSPMSAGANALIQEGARLVRTADDILSELNLSAVVQQAELAAAVPEGAAESALLGLLGVEPTHIDEVTRASRLSAAEVSSGLALLELKGYVRQVGGMQYVRLRELGQAYSA
ncbi:MAG TPA: DNA-processing protein DprA [Dehalococcoidia bacterium]|nr:DNA-processing protein DprA [Dehalococcoidia bacterium]